MVTLLTGPGTHIALLRGVLQAAGYLDRVVSYYPDWAVWGAHGQRVDTFPPYRWFIHMMWALWRRLPRIGGQEHPRAWHFALYDWLTSQRMSLSPVLWAWWGTSLYTMRKARRGGSLILLEAPACHPRTWNAIARPLYQQHFPKAKTTYALLPSNLVARLEAEIEEAHAIQVLSSFAKQTFLDHGVSAEKLHTLPLGVDTALFYPESQGRNEKGRFVVLYVGRIDPLKGVHYLLEAFQRLRLPGAALWLVGHVVDEMKPLLSKHLGEEVRYVGPKSQGELRAFYNMADIVVLPTLLDSFGMVILEAMACGRPVIATTHSGAPDIFTGDAEKLVPPASVEALMQAIEEIYRTPEWLTEAGKTSYQRVMECYTILAYRERVKFYLTEVRYGMA